MSRRDGASVYSSQQILYCLYNFDAVSPRYFPVEMTHTIMPFNIDMQVHHTDVLKGVVS